MALRSSKVWNVASALNSGGFWCNKAVVKVVWALLQGTQQGGLQQCMWKEVSTVIATLRCQPLTLDVKLTKVHHQGWGCRFCIDHELKGSWLENTNSVRSGEVKIWSSGCSLQSDPCFEMSADLGLYTNWWRTQNFAALWMGRKSCFC